MKTTSNLLMLGCLVVALQFISCDNSNENEPQPPAIGDFYQGGVVFYLDNLGQHGFIVAIADQSTSAEWCGNTDGIGGAEGFVIGTGYQNTIDIVEGCATPGNAAAICANLTLNGQSDWFLPSIDELEEVYKQKAAVNATTIANGGTALADGTYWSSTEPDLGTVANAMTLNMEDGAAGYLTKFGTARVRAIRAF